MDNNFKYREIPPPQSLTRYVKFFWTIESTLPQYIHRSMADTCCELVFHYKGDFEEMKNGNKQRLNRSGVKGQCSDVSQLITDSGFGIFGIYLYPYALPLLLKLNSSELTNQQIPLEDLLGKVGKEFEELILTANNNSERLERVIRFLDMSFRKIDPPLIVKAIYQVMEYEAPLNINALSSQFNMSERNFSRRFKEFSGFNPQQFLAIRRFEKVIEQYQHSTNSLTEIALWGGYYDQSHFIRDFKKYSGYKPKEFFFHYPKDMLWLEGH